MLILMKNKNGKKIKYIINRRPSSIKKLSKSGQYAAKKKEHQKSSVRYKVEHVFAVIKNIFRYRKTRYRGLRKQTAKLNIMFALANLYLAARKYYIFSSCMKLKTVKINGSVISSYTFAFCYALSNLTISVNCKSIGSNIIAYCQYLDTINYEGTIAQWNSIQKPDNWISSAEHNYNGYLKKIQCSNGYLEYDTVNYTWKEVKN